MPEYFISPWGPRSSAIRYWHYQLSFQGYSSLRPFVESPGEWRAATVLWLHTQARYTQACQGGYGEVCPMIPPHRGESPGSPWLACSWGAAPIIEFLARFPGAASLSIRYLRGDWSVTTGSPGTRHGQSAGVLNAWILGCWGPVARSPGRYASVSERWTTEDAASGILQVPSRLRIALSGLPWAPPDSVADSHHRTYAPGKG